MSLTEDLKKKHGLMPYEGRSERGSKIPPLFLPALFVMAGTYAHENGISHTKVWSAIGMLQGRFSVLFRGEGQPRLGEARDLAAWLQMQDQVRFANLTEQALKDWDAHDTEVREAWRTQRRIDGNAMQAAKTAARRKAESARPTPARQEPGKVSTPPLEKPIRKTPPLSLGAQKAAVAEATREVIGRALSPAPAPTARAVGFVLPKKEPRKPQDVRADLIPWVRKSFGMKPNDPLNVTVVVSLEDLLAAMTKFVVEYE